MCTISQSETPAKSKLRLVFLLLCLPCDWKNWTFLSPLQCTELGCRYQPPYIAWPCQTRPLHKWKMSPARLQKLEGARGLACLFVYLLVHLFDCLFTSSRMLSGLGRVPPTCHARGMQYSGPEPNAHSPAWSQPWWGLWGCCCRKFFWAVLVFQCLCVICVETLRRQIQVWGSA